LVDPFAALQNGLQNPPSACDDHQVEIERSKNLSEFQWCFYMKNLKPLMLAVIMALLVVAAGMGFLFGFDNPVSWVLIAILIAIPVIYKRAAQADQLVWKESYSVGIAQIDDEHRRLIELLNKFQAAYKYHMGEEFEQQALKALVDYTKYHFKNEESLMQKYDYPDFNGHVEQHRAMIAEVDSFVRQYEEKGHEALEGVVLYLQGWLIKHINGTDKQYSSFLNERGVY
jgi:hemerythrin-like metal-binding protein